MKLRNVQGKRIDVFMDYKIILPCSLEPTRRKIIEDIHEMTNNSKSINVKCIKPIGGRASG